jgi:putative transposase
MRLRKIMKTRCHFPNDHTATKLLWPALRNVIGKSTRSTREEKIAMNQFAILYRERFTGSRSRKPPRTQNFRHLFLRRASFNSRPASSLCRKPVY